MKNEMISNNSTINKASFQLPIIEMNLEMLQNIDGGKI